MFTRGQDRAERSPRVKYYVDAPSGQREGSSEGTGERPGSIRPANDPLRRFERKKPKEDRGAGTRDGAREAFDGRYAATMKDFFPGRATASFEQQWISTTGLRREGSTNRDLAEVEEEVMLPPIKQGSGNASLSHFAGGGGLEIQVCSGKAGGKLMRKNAH